MQHNFVMKFLKVKSNEINYTKGPFEIDLQDALALFNISLTLYYKDKLRYIKFYSREFQMRIATAPHHTNPRSATLDFWRKERIHLLKTLEEK